MMFNGGIVISFIRKIILLTLAFSNPVLSETKDVHHIGLTVADLSSSQRFFTEYVGFHLVGKDESYPSVFLTNNKLMITLWQVSDQTSYVSFDRKNNVGLHHLAFGVESLDSLTKLYTELKNDPLVKVEFSPELLGSGPAQHMMVYEPGGNRIEFIFRP